MSPSPDRHVTRSLSQSDQPTAPTPMLPTQQFYMRAPYEPAITTDQLPATDTRVNTDPLPSTPQDMPTRATGQLPAGLPDPSTGQFPINTPRVTRQLTIARPTTTTKLPTLIPATEKRPRVSAPPSPPRRRPIMFIAALASSVIMLILTALLVTPLGSGQHEQTLTQTIGNFFSTGSLGSFSPSEHLATPSPTPALLTNDGYCGGTDIWGTCATAVTASGVMGTGVMQRPIIGATITQPFAHPEYQVWCGCIKPHSGIDLAAPYGTPIMAADSGQVIWTGWDWSGLGWAVKINHGHYIATIYGHMARYIVQVGQNVTRGQVIGYEGSTGASTGPHVHFMVLVNNIWVDPQLYVTLP